VGCAPALTITRTMLFLSRKVTRAPVPRWAHPSGYFIEYTEEGSRKRMNTWLSGMSPVAAAVASACRAEGAELVVVWLDAVVELVSVWAGARGALLLPEPQPPISSAATKTGTRADIHDNARGGHLNGA